MAKKKMLIVMIGTEPGNQRLGRQGRAFRQEGGSSGL